MFSKDFVIEKLAHIKDTASDNPIIIEAVSGNEEKRHINVKAAITQTEQAKKQEIEAKIEYELKMAGAKTVGVIFTELPAFVAPKEETILTTKNPPIFIAIASGKGGVGKSTVTVNLGIALARLGKRVGLVDADIYGPSIPNMMGIKDKPVVESDKVIPIEKHGVKVVSMEFFKKDDEPVIWRGPMLGRMIDVFLNQVRWGELDFMLLDLPPGTGDIALDISKRIPQCKEIIVTTPHPTAASIAKQAGKMAIHTNHQILGIVENMSYIDSSDGVRQYVFGEGGGQQLADELNSPLIAQIPLSSPPQGKDGDIGVYNEFHPLSDIYKELALKIS